MTGRRALTVMSFRIGADENEYPEVATVRVSFERYWIAGKPELT
jgi:hypothetical protein